MSIRYAREVNPICGDCFASSANRCCFVDTGLEFRSIRRISLQRFHDPTPRFPPRGPGGSRVHASPVLSRRYDFLPPFPPRFVAFAWRYLSGRLVIRSHRPKRNFGGPGVLWVRQPPTPTCPWRRQDLPSSRETPIAHSHRFFDSGRTARPHYHDGAAARPPQEEQRRLLHWDFRSSIAWLLGSLSTLRRVGPPTTYARLASRCWSGSPWAGLITRKVSLKGFELFLTSHPPFPSCAWRDPLFCPCVSVLFCPCEP